MKKRKIKLFASVASLAMVAAVMGVGVWAATQQSLSVSSQVSFAATGIEGTVKLQVSGGAVKTADNGIASNEEGYVDYKTQTTIATFALADTQNKQTTIETIDIALNDVDGDGFFGAADTTNVEQTVNAITYTFTIHNGSTQDPQIGLHFAVDCDATDAWAVAIQVGTVGSLTATTTGDASEEDQIVVVTYTYIEKIGGEGADKDNPKLNPSMTDVDLPDITIHFANTAENLPDAEG